MRKNRRRELKKDARPGCHGRQACAGRRRQRDVLCDVMLSARQCETWLTLEELAKLTHYPQASISAQLRHLRKPEYGGHVVEKRPRGTGCGVARGRLRHGVGVPASARHSQEGRR